MNEDGPRWLDKTIILLSQRQDAVQRGPTGANDLTPGDRMPPSTARVTLLADQADIGTEGQLAQLGVIAFGKLALLGLLLELLDLLGEASPMHHARLGPIPSVRLHPSAPRAKLFEP